MNKKWSLFYFIICIILTSCEKTEIENNLRVLVTGNISDQYVTPIPDAKVEV